MIKIYITDTTLINLVVLEPKVNWLPCVWNFRIKSVGDKLLVGDEEILHRWEDVQEIPL